MNSDPRRNKCEDSEDDSGGASSSAPESDGLIEPSYEVKELLDVRVISKGKSHQRRRVVGRQFLVWWKGYRRSEATWEEERNILDAQLIKDFEAQRAAADARDDEPAPDAVDEDVIDDVGRGGGGGRRRV